MPPRVRAGGLDTSAMKAHSGDLAQMFDQIKRQEDELAEGQKRAKASIAAQEIDINHRIDEMRRVLPTRGRLFLALLVAIAADSFGWIPIMGYVVDLIAIGLLSVLLKTPVIKGVGNLFYIPELVPFLDQAWFLGYTARVITFYIVHRSAYGSFKDLFNVKHKLSEANKGIKNFRSVIGGFFSALLPLFVIMILVFSGCGIQALVIDDSPFPNPVGNAIVNSIPPLKAFKASGRIDRFFDQYFVEFSSANWNLDPVGWFENLLNQSTAIAGDNYYSTTVEETQGMDLGLEVSDIDFLSYNTIGTDLDYSFIVTGSTFVDSSTPATPSCYLKKPRVLIDDGKQYGTPIPTSFNLNKDIPVQQLVMCNVDTNNLEPGYYQAFANLEYDFEVWSYIPYVFVSRATFETYGDDINQKLAIDRNTQSLSTNGPMILAISELSTRIPQPYVILDDQESNFLINFKLENKDKGRIKELDHVILQVPQEFDVTCFRPEGSWEVEGSSNEGSSFWNDAWDIITNQLGGVDSSFLDDYKVVYLHTFSENELENNQINFKCQLTLPEGRSFLDSGVKTTKTIVATAKYKYLLESMKTVELIDPAVVS